MASLQISKIQMRRGFEVDLPGSPTSLSPLTFAPGLDVGEFAFAIDTGRLFVGQNPTAGQPNNLRTAFPYQSVEILTENATSTIRKIFENFHRYIGSGGFFQASLVSSTQDWTDIPVAQTTGDSIPFVIDGDNLVTSIEYFVTDTNGVPLRQGTLRAVSQPGDVEPLCLDDCLSAPRSDLTGSDAVDPTLINNNVQLRFIKDGTQQDPYFRFQYQNSLSSSLNFFFSVFRPVLHGPASPFMGQRDASGNTQASAYYPVSQVGVSSNTVTLDASTANTFLVTLSANVTAISIVDWPAGSHERKITVYFQQDNTGGRTVSGWPSGTKWVGGVIPTISQAANQTDCIVLDSFDAGTTIYANLIGQNYS